MDPGANCFVIDNNEPPRLAQPHGWSKTRKLNKVFQHSGRQLIAPKMAHIAAPNQ